MTKIDRTTTKPIISVKEARKLLGKEISDELTDERVAEVVMLLHGIAEYYIKQEMEKRADPC